MRFLFLLSCAAITSSTIAIFLPDGSAQMDSSLFHDDATNPDLNSPSDSFPISPDPNSVSVASNLDAETNLDANNVEPLMVESDDMDFTFVGDETPLASACDQQSSGNVHRRGTGLCRQHRSSASEPNPDIAVPLTDPKKIDMPEVTTIDDDKKKDCPEEFIEHLCCEGSIETRYRHPIGYWFFHRVQKCVLCEYSCLLACYFRRGF